MNGHCPAPRGPADCAGARLSGIALVGVVGAITLVVFTGGVAQAAVTNFTMTPDSGPPGTVVHVSGTGCTPGPARLDRHRLRHPDRDHARPRDSGTGRGERILAGLVHRSGRNDRTGAAPVDAVCVSSGIQSLVDDLYAAVFSVTTATTTTVGTNPAPGGTTSTVRRRRERRRVQAGHEADLARAARATEADDRSRFDGLRARGTPAAEVGVGAVPRVQRRVESERSRSARPLRSRRRGPRVMACGSRRRRRARGAAAATLQPADLGALTPANDGSGGLRRLRWLLLLVLTLAVIGVPAWLWRSRRNHIDAGSGR